MEIETAASRTKLREDLEKIDVDGLKFDAIFQLKTWHKKMHALIDETYQKRLQQINGIAADRLERIENIDLENGDHLEEEIDQLKSSICVIESIPDNFGKRIDRTIRIDDDEMVRVDADDEFEDDDDEPVIVDIADGQMKHEDRLTVVFATQPAAPAQSVASKVFNSQPVQHAIGVTLARALTNVGTIAATTTTTAAATTMAKTVVIAAACGVGTVAYGVGRIAVGTSKKLWSLVASSDE